MKKLVGLLIAGTVVLAPTAVFADTNVVISGIVAATPTPSVTTDTTGTAPVDTSLSPQDAKKAEHQAEEAAKKQAKEDAKDAKRAADAAKKVAREATKELRVDDSAPGQSASWDNPSLIHNGGLKFG